MTKLGFLLKHAVVDLDCMAGKSNLVINAAEKSSLLGMEQTVQEARCLVLNWTNQGELAVKPNAIYRRNTLTF